MTPVARAASAILASLSMLWLACAAASGQERTLGCATERDGGGRQVLRCPDGLVIVIEAGARFGLVDRDGNGVADALTLRSKAVLVDGPARRAPFQVITPQAIAAVRGTEWAVDVGGGKTAVFVVSGRVSVRRTTSNAGVVLGAGEGVDVERGEAPLVVRRWGAPRVAALLGRLGR